jgi:hypothetical protein
VGHVVTPARDDEELAPIIDETVDEGLVPTRKEANSPFRIKEGSVQIGADNFVLFHGTRITITSPSTKLKSFLYLKKRAGVEIPPALKGEKQFYLSLFSAWITP